MNVVGIADLFAPQTVMRAALATLEPSRLDVIDWPNQDIQQLHHRVRRIERDGPDTDEPPPALWSLLDDVELIVTHMCPIGTEVIRRAPKLRTIGVCRAGTETIAMDAAEARGIRVVRVPGRNAVAVAEYAVGMILAERRNIARAHHAIAAGGWRKDFTNSAQESELAGKIVGLVGFGAIGRLVVQRLEPFGVELLVHDPFQSTQDVEACGCRCAALDELLTRSDVVSLHARRDPGEPPLIGPRELALMKPTACLINTARAYLVDTDALIDALSQRRISGAALDVFEEEPIDPDSPLRRLDNVTLTPHLAGSTREAFRRSPQMLVDMIKEDRTESDEATKGRSDEGEG